MITTTHEEFFEKRAKDSLASYEAQMPDTVTLVPLPQLQGKLFIGDINSLKLCNQLKIDLAISLCSLNGIESNYMTSTLPIQHVKIDVDDNGDSINIQKMKQTLDQYTLNVISKLSNSENVLVHCQAGISRSATFVAKIISQVLNISAIEAISYLATYRPAVCPNWYFFKMLISA